MASVTDGAKLVPPLPDFHHAIIDDFQLGPPRQLTLHLRQLFWGPEVSGQSQGHYGEPVTVHLGGIVNFEDVQALFDRQRNSRKALAQRAELAWLRYDPHQPSKPGSLFLELAYERVELHLSIQCSQVTVTEAEPSAVQQDSMVSCQGATPDGHCCLVPYSIEKQVQWQCLPVRLSVRWLAIVFEQERREDWQE